MEAEACVLPLSEAEENYDHLDIGQLVTALWRRSCTTTTTSNVGTPSLTTVQKWFSARGFDLYLAGGDNDCGMVQIMYQAKRASSIDWRPRWTRQCRGVILQLPIPTTSDKNKSDYHVRIVRYLLQRGEEVMTSLHNNNNNHHNRQPGNAVPDDVRATTTSRFARLDDNQQETIRQLQAGKEIVGEVTMKVDGMLCAYTFYRGTSAKDVWNLLLSAANDNDDGPNFALAMAAACRQAHKDYITVLSTQRTMYITDMRTQAYVLTAMLSSIGLQGELQQFLATSSRRQASSSIISRDNHHTSRRRASFCVANHRGHGWLL